MSLAELVPIYLSKDRLEIEWKTFYKTKINNEVYDWRIYPELNYLTPYLQEYIKSIIMIVGIEPKNFLFQIATEHNMPDKESLSIVHRDDDRKSCITVPILYNQHETVMFYNDDPNINWRLFSKTRKQWPNKPIKLSRYSNNHPTLVNVNQLHNVRIMDKTSNRVLLQLSFDETFEEIINRNPNIWRIL